MTAARKLDTDLAELGRRFHAMSPWRHTPYDADAVSAFLVELANNPDGYLVCTEHGLIGGVLSPLWFAPSVTVAVELFWYSESKGEGQKLRDGFEAWAKERGAGYTQFSILSDKHEEDMRRAMMRQGYDAIEVGLRKAL